MWPKSHDSTPQLSCMNSVAWHELLCTGGFTSMALAAYPFKPPNGFGTAPGASIGALRAGL